VELDPLSAEDFVRILTEPQNALLKQYTALLSTEGVSIEFTPEAIHEIANTAALVNERTENIGARRLHTVMTTLLEDILFSASEGKYKKVRITPEEVQERLSGIVQDQDLSRYIL
jgi:ATP-dependent HslUV protease ATP-binding subunit HslU